MVRTDVNNFILLRFNSKYKYPIFAKRSKQKRWSQKLGFAPSPLKGVYNNKLIINKSPLGDLGASNKRGGY